MPDTIIDRLFQRIATGDLAGAVDLTTDNVVFEAQGPAAVPIYNHFTGHNGVRQFFTTLEEMFDTEKFEIRSTLENKHVAFGYGYMQHRVKKTDVVFMSEWALYCTVTDGKISHYRMFEDTAALVAAYVSP